MALDFPWKFHPWVHSMVFCGKIKGAKELFNSHIWNPSKWYLYPPLVDFYGKLIITIGINLTLQWKGE